jgi:hypothetical protein
VERWEEPLHHGSLARIYPTLPHNATLIAHFFPLFLPNALPEAIKGCISGLLGAPRTGATSLPTTQGALQPDGMAANLHTISVLRSFSTSLGLGACALLLGLAGCGSSSTPPPDPATVVPASAPLYIGAVVQPSGALKSDTEADAHELTHSGEPFSGLLKLLSPSGHPIDYASEVKPWLGANAGAFLTSIDAAKATSALAGTLSEVLTSGNVAALGEGALSGLLSGRYAQGAVVLDTTNVSKAQSFLQARASEAGAHATSYKGVSYYAAADGNAEGVVGEFAVIGSEAALKSVIETEQAGATSSITHAAGYSKLASTAEAGALAHLYLRSAALSSLDGLLAGTEQAYISLLPEAHPIALDVDSIPSPQAKEGAGVLPSASTAQVVGALPGGSWLAAGVSNVNATFGSEPKALRTLAGLLAKVQIGNYSLEGALAPLTSPSVELNSDLLSWMSSAGVFASGSGLLNLQAGLVATSTDPTRSREAVAKLAAAYTKAGAEATPTTIPGAEEAVTVRIPNFPVVVAIGASNDKFAIGAGPASVQEALNPSTTLSTSPAYQTAATTLGHGLKPSLLVEFPTLVTLIETLGLTQTGAISGVLPYLQSLSTLTAGGGESLGNGVTRTRVVLGLGNS